jgi:nitroreductase
MDFFSVLKERRSVRLFRDQPLEPEKLQQLLDAVHGAPSAGNLQAYEVYLIDDVKHKAALVRAASGQEFLGQAAVVLVFCAHPARSVGRYGKRGAELYCVQDATIACTFAMLAATALELASVWVGAFDEDAVRRAINVAQAHRPVALLPVGYAAESPRMGPRRSQDDLVHHVE